MEENNHMKKISPTAEQDIHVVDEVKENKMLKGDGADLEAIHVAVEAKEKKVLKGDGADLETLKAKRTQSELGSRKKVCLSSASVAYHRTNMYFKEIEGGLCKNELLFRLIHWWEARHTSKDGLLLGLEMLLIDEQGETIKGFIAPNWMPRFQRDLKRGSVFRLTHFYAKANNETFRISEHPQKICFTNLSRLIEVYDDIPEIEADFFRFRPFAEFEASADKKLGLYDVMGQVKHIAGNTVQQESDIAGLRSNIADGEKEKFTVHLQLEGGELVIINLWDNAAAEFGEKYRGSKNNPTVLLVTTVNPKRFLGRVTLNSMSPSRVFIDKDIPTTEAFLNSLGASGRSAVTVQRTECKVTKLETVTLGEILQFVRNQPPQVASFVTRAKVLDIVLDYGWYYISCTQCKKKLTRSADTLVCNACNNPKAVGLIRYRVELAVEDGDNIATFVLFDREAAELAGIQAADYVESYHEDGNIEAEEVQVPVPQGLLNAIGHTYRLEVKVTEYNFRAKRQTITVARILEEVEIENHSEIDGATSELASTSNEKIQDGGETDVHPPVEKPNKQSGT